MSADPTKATARAVPVAAPRPSEEFPRGFVPADADLGDWEQVEPLFRDLAERSVDSAVELEAWLRDRSELEACLAEERARRYIAMTCHTDDEELEARYLEFIEGVVPRSKPWRHRLNERFVESPFRDELDPERYRVLDRDVAVEIEIFREDNVPLQTEASKLSQRYQKICGAMTVEFDGEERTLPQMARYLEETDRQLRRRAWEAIVERRLKDRDELDRIFDELVELRHRIACNAGFDDYRGYAFRSMGRFDYGPEDAEAFHEAVQRCVVPLARRIDERRRERLGVERLRPWDLAVDPLGRPPLRPFADAEELARGVQGILARLDGELAGQFASLREGGELDLDSRKGKAPGGYMSTLDEVRRPFIFMNAAGLHRDVETLLHESGHAFHALATRAEPLHHYRHAPIEFAEVASMTMELLADDHLDVFYDEDEAARAKRQHLEGVVGLLPWVARVDAFQHWIYTHPDHDRAGRTAAWLELDDRLGPRLDWSGHEDAREAQWQRQLHVFCYPFYYIEYGIAQLGALQIWRRARERGVDEALQAYRRGLALGGSRPLPELFEAAGARFDFSEETLRPLVELVDRELGALSA